MLEREASISRDAEEDALLDRRVHREFFDQVSEPRPTRGGLRIGKKLPERDPDEPFAERLEWDRDGQYFHYLTKWMHALDQVSSITGAPRFNLWARELAEVAHAAFTYGPPGARHMVWKMSSDLSRPLVPSMGQHDALDGFITCVQLEKTASRPSSTPAGPSLEPAVTDFATMRSSSAGEHSRARTSSSACSQRHRRAFPCVHIAPTGESPRLGASLFGSSVWRSDSAIELIQTAKE